MYMKFSLPQTFAFKFSTKYFSIVLAMIVVVGVVIIVFGYDYEYYGKNLEIIWL